MLKLRSCRACRSMHGRREQFPHDQSKIVHSIQLGEKDNRAEGRHTPSREEHHAVCVPQVNARRRSARGVALRAKPRDIQRYQAHARRPGCVPCWARLSSLWILRENLIDAVCRSGAPLAVLWHTISRESHMPILLFGHIGSIR